MITYFEPREQTRGGLGGFAKGSPGDTSVGRGGKGEYKYRAKK